MFGKLLLIALCMTAVISPETTVDKSGADISKPKDGVTDIFMKPILYGTALILVVILISIVGFIYNMDEEKDPLIYSKFLTVRKKNN